VITDKLVRAQRAKLLVL